MYISCPQGVLIMDKFKNVLLAAAFAGNASYASAEEKPLQLVEIERSNITCVDNRNGAFSFYMQGYDEPMISILKSDYGWDANHAVFSFAPESLPEVYKGSLIDNENVKVSEAFKSTFSDFNGRFLMFYEPDDKGRKLCSIEMELDKINTIYRTFVERVDSAPKPASN